MLWHLTIYLHYKPPYYVCQGVAHLRFHQVSGVGEPMPIVSLSATYHGFGKQDPLVVLTTRAYPI
jgi:hypothetical protein